MKKRITNLASDLIFIITFNIVFFLLMGFSNSASVWIQYVFVHISYAMFALNSDTVPKSKLSYLYGSVIDKYTFLYFALSFVVALIVFFVKPKEFVLSLSIQIILLSAYLIFYFYLTKYNAITNDKQQLYEKNLAYRDTVLAKLKLVYIESNVNSEIIDIKYNDLLNKIKSSSLSSNASSMIYEKEIIDILNNMINSKIKLSEYQINEIETLVRKRNSVI